MDAVWTYLDERGIDLTTANKDSVFHQLKSALYTWFSNGSSSGTGSGSGSGGDVGAVVVVVGLYSCHAVMTSIKLAGQLQPNGRLANTPEVKINLYMHGKTKAPLGIVPLVHQPA